MSTHHTSPTARTARTARTVRRLVLPVLPVLAVAGVLAAPGSPAAATPSALTCGTVVTTDVRLTADLLDCPGSGLVVGAPGVTIDLAGHVIDGTGSGAGIDNAAGHDDVRIRRGTVRDFVFGVVLFQAGGARLERLDAIANLDGFKIASSVDVELDRVTATGNVGPGVEITFSDQVTVRRSTFTDNGLGGVVDRFSERSRHVRNTIVGNDASGLTLDRTGGAVVERNRVAANAGHGIELVAIGDAQVVRNDADANHGDGISIDAPGNVLRANRTTGNAGAGISAPEGTVDGGGNRARGNGGNGGTDCTGVSCR
jgi:hypothetical protein